MAQISFTVNGRPQTVDVPPQIPLHSTADETGWSKRIICSVR